MYQPEWIEQLKSSRAARPAVADVSPVVWSLGFTSLLTDVSSEMVNSVLPMYLVLHLHLSPLQYGLVDGLYNGFAVALVSLAAGVVADRMRRQKEVALTGYGISAICKPLLIAAAGNWGSILAIVGFDRMGKGLRAAPRDAMISLNSEPHIMATAFAVHRTLDAGGSLLGPIVAFALLWQLPGAFDFIWLTSLAFALIGLAVLWLFVPNPRPVARSSTLVPKPRPGLNALFSPGFLALTGSATLLSLSTISDGFLYLTLQQKGHTNSGFFPLYYVLTAGSCLLFALPAGRVADRLGRTRVFLAGYAALGLIYLLLLLQNDLGLLEQLSCLTLLGLHYACTGGVLVAMASIVIPHEARASGLAVLATFIGIGKLLSSVMFGWTWQAHGTVISLVIFGGALVAAAAVSAFWLRRAKLMPVPSRNPATN